MSFLIVDIDCYLFQTRPRMMWRSWRFALSWTVSDSTNPANGCLPTRGQQRSTERSKWTSLPSEGDLTLMETGVTPSLWGGMVREVKSQNWLSDFRKWKENGILGGSVAIIVAFSPEILFCHPCGCMCTRKESHSQRTKSANYCGTSSAINTEHIKKTYVK